MQPWLGLLATLEHKPSSSSLLFLAFCPMQFHTERCCTKGVMRVILHMCAGIAKGQHHLCSFQSLPLCKEIPSLNKDQ